jgi:hypothetical protein
MSNGLRDKPKHACAICLTPTPPRRLLTISPPGIVRHQNPEDSKCWYVEGPYLSTHSDKLFTGAQIPPYIVEKCLAAYNIVCDDCIKKWEIEALKAYPLEDLPLMLNVRWLTVGGSVVYKYRISGVMPSK